MRPWRSLYLIAWVVWLIDLGTKVWAEKVLSTRANIEILGTFCNLRLFETLEQLLASALAKQLSLLFLH